MFFTRAQQGNLLFPACLLLGAALLAAGAAAQAVNAAPQGDDSQGSSVPVIVSDFELYSIPTGPASPPVGTPPANGAKPKKPEIPLVYQDTSVPSSQARQLIDFFSITLLQTLQKQNFQAVRGQPQNPGNGVLLRGVFAESDAKNRIRRALLGSDSPNSRFLLYVGIFNLARPDQPLYQLASEQPTANRYGPVITLNNYIPLAKYELDKNPTEEDVRKICAQISASLVTLLKANPNAFAQ